MRLKSLFVSLGIVLALFGLQGCSSSSPVIPEEPDYADTQLWYQPINRTAEKDVDVFYIISTCSFDWKTEKGEVCHFMNPTDSAQRAYMNPYMEEGNLLFAPECNFYAPYYRQISMESWYEDSAEIENRFAYAMKDVVKAFRYYMEHFNNGKPFVLAGHSQGGKAVIELLKHTLTPEEYDRMIAAYVFGYSITQEELDTYPMLKPVENTTDRGVICFNTISRPDAVSSLFRNNVVCVNPLSWTTDTTYAPATENRGSLFFKPETLSFDTLVQQVGVRIDEPTHCLMIDGLNDTLYYVDAVGKLFPMGNYHLYEQNLYALNLQYNLARRIAANK